MSLGGSCFISDRKQEVSLEEGAAVEVVSTAFSLITGESQQEPAVTSPRVLHRRCPTTNQEEIQGS